MSKNLKNRAYVTSTTTTKSKSKKKGSKIRSKMKTKSFSTVISEGGLSKKGAFKQKSKSTSKNKSGKLKTKSYAVNKDGTGTVASSTLRNKRGRARTIENKKKAENKYTRVSKRFQKQADKKQKRA